MKYNLIKDNLKSSKQNNVRRNLDEKSVKTMINVRLKISFPVSSTIKHVYLVMHT